MKTETIVLKISVKELKDFIELMQLIVDHENEIIGSIAEDEDIINDLTYKLQCILPKFQEALYALFVPELAQEIKKHFGVKFGKYPEETLTEALSVIAQENEFRLLPLRQRN